MDTFYVVEAVCGGCAIACGLAGLGSQLLHNKRQKALRPKPDLMEIDPNHPWMLMITDQFQQAVKEAIAEHHRNGRQIAVHRDGKLVYISPEDNK